MLKHYYKLIFDRYSLDEVAIVINPQQNSLTLFLYHSIYFIIRFCGCSYSIDMILENGQVSHIIGGQSLTDTITDDNLLESISYIMRYTRLRLGKKFLEVRKSDD